MEMVDLRSRQESHGIAVWLSMLERELGSPALEAYHSMSDAVPIILPPDCLSVVEGLKWRLERQDQEEFCLGFSEDSLRAKPAIVKGLDPNLGSQERLRQAWRKGILSPPSTVSSLLLRDGIGTSV